MDNLFTAWFYTLSTIAQAVASILSLSAIIFIFQLERISSRVDRFITRSIQYLQLLWGPDKEIISMSNKEIIDLVESDKSKEKLKEFEVANPDNQYKLGEKRDINLRLLRRELKKSNELRSSFLISLIASLVLILVSIFYLTFSNYFFSLPNCIIKLLITITWVAFIAIFSNGYFWYRLARIDN
jgi:hypothetical protein